MANEATSLIALRREIDRIDDQIHDLLMQRTRIVENVRNVKRGQKIKIRPSRESEIIYRLMARHKGPFPRRELVRIWREIIVATLSFEGPFGVAVYVPEGEPGIWDLARDQYGSFTPTARHTNPRGVIQAVRDQAATVGVLPLPRADDQDPWWRHLMTTSADAPRVIARLPVAGDGRADQPDALVICPIAVEPTGRDRSLVAFESAQPLTMDQCAEALRATGIRADAVGSWREAGPPALAQHLFDAEGHFPADDRRLAGLAEAQGLGAARVLVLGSYGVPLTPEELDRVVPDDIDRVVPDDIDRVVPDDIDRVMPDGEAPAAAQPEPAPTAPVRAKGAKAKPKPTAKKGRKR